MIETEGRTWKAVKKACEEGLANARTLLETPHVDQRVADLARGEISAFNLILSLAREGTIKPPAPTGKIADISGV